MGASLKESCLQRQKAQAPKSAQGHGAEQVQNKEFRIFEPPFPDPHKAAHRPWKAELGKCGTRLTGLCQDIETEFCWEILAHSTLLQVNVDESIHEP